MLAIVISTYNVAHAPCVGEEPRVRFPRARDPRGKFWCPEAFSLPPHALKPATHLAILYADRGEFDRQRKSLAIFSGD